MSWLPISLTPTLYIDNSTTGHAATLQISHVHPSVLSGSLIFFIWSTDCRCPLLALAGWRQSADLSLFLFLVWKG